MSAPAAGEARRPVRALLRAAAVVLALCGGAIASAAALLTTASIIGRALWSSPIQGDVELTQCGIAIAIAMCLPWCQFQKANIIVDFFTLRAAPAVRRRLDAAGALLLALMMALLAWRTWEGALAALSSGETTIILGVPMWPVYAVLAPGLALTAVIALYQACVEMGPAAAQDRPA
ncbi:MAG: TRAP transporter small permease [Burkholderiaceae bacterium]